MNKKSIMITLLLVLILILSGCFALAEPEQSSGAVSAPTVAPAGQTPDQTAAEPVEAYPAAEPTPLPAAPAAAEAYPAEEPAPEPVPVELPAGYPAPAGTTGEIVGQAAVYDIDPAQSEARFTINEVLRGNPKTVVGVTSNLGGQIALDLANPGAAQVGTILINARDIKTDDDFRNRAIANEILKTNDYEFITFEPTAISGLPQAAEVGQTYDLQMTGDLTITDQTREVTFDVEVTPVSESELHGLAVLDILYADFGLVIPFARAVESVEDNVILELEFVAVQP